MQSGSTRASALKSGYSVFSKSSGVFWTVYRSLLRKLLSDLRISETSEFDRKNGDVSENSVSRPEESSSERYSYLDRETDTRTTQGLPALSSPKTAKYRNFGTPSEDQRLRTLKQQSTPPNTAILPGIKRFVACSEARREKVATRNRRCEEV